MSESRKLARAFFPSLAVLALVLSIVSAGPAAAIDIFSRASEVDLLLRDAGRLKGLQVTVEIRILTVGDQFLERVGVDFSGSVNGEVTKNGQPVQNAKLILEAFRVDNVNGGGVVVSRTGRQVVTTDSAGKFQLQMKALVGADARADILAGAVASLRIEATGKNGKRVDHVHLRASSALGGLID